MSGPTLITTVACLQLEEAGVLALEDPICKATVRDGAHGRPGRGKGRPRAGPCHPAPPGARHGGRGPGRRRGAAAAARARDYCDSRHDIL